MTPGTEKPFKPYKYWQAQKVSLQPQKHVSVSFGRLADPVIFSDKKVNSGWRGLRRPNKASVFTEREREEILLKSLQKGKGKKYYSSHFLWGKRKELSPSEAPELGEVGEGYEGMPLCTFKGKKWGHPRTGCNTQL